MVEREEHKFLRPVLAGYGGFPSTKFVYQIEGIYNSIDLSLLKNRFASALSNYKTTRQNGGKFVFLLHDLWGADGSENSSAPFPGDGGDWSSWDNFLTTWISDMNANDATTGLVIDIWNEPDGTGFWKRTSAQWLQMWGRTYYRLR
jgi:hypothetical protein